MSTLPPNPDPADRALGRRLAERLERLGSMAPERIRGLLPELLGEDPSLQAPLHDLVARPGFGRLLASDGERRRAGLREQLLRDLSETYSSRMTARLGAVLDGVLEPPPGRVPTAAATTAAGPARRRGPSRRPGEAPRSSLAGLVALTAAVALGSGLLFGVLRSNRLCPSLGLCLPERGGAEGAATIDGALERAGQAARLMDGAGSLEDFAAGLDRLDAALLNLVSRRLNPRQESDRQRLQSRADAAHRRLRQEQRAQRSLEEAAALIGELERTTVAGPQRLDALAEAQARLDEVPADSFARSSVASLERRLAAVRDRPPEPEARPGAPEPPSGAPSAAPSGETTAPPAPAQLPPPRPEAGGAPPAPPPPPLPPPPVEAPPAPTPEPPAP